MPSQEKWTIVCKKNLFLNGAKKRKNEEDKLKFLNNFFFKHVNVHYAIKG